MSGEKDCFRFSVRSGHAVLVSYTGGEEYVRIPGEYEGCPVTAVGSYAFYDHGAEVKSIAVPGSVKRILPHAFELCIACTEIILEDGIQEIGENAFAATAVRTLHIPSSVRRIHNPSAIPCGVTVSGDNSVFTTDGFGLYEGTVLAAVNPDDPRTEYAVKEGTTDISMGVFDDRNSLKSIHLPASLEYVGESVFSNVRSEYSGEKGITDISVDPGNPRFFRDPHFFGEKISFGIRIIRWLGEEEDVILPEEIREIARDAFSGRKIRKVSIPGGILKIEPDSFRGCPLKEAVVREQGIKVVFPDDQPYLRKDLLRGFGRSGMLYDFKSYDEKLREWFPDTGRTEMILERLMNGYGLSDSMRSHYRSVIENHMSEITGLIADDRRMDLLVMLEELGFFTDLNIGEAIMILGIKGCHEMAASLSGWKHRNLKSSEYDYSL